MDGHAHSSVHNKYSPLQVGSYATETTTWTRPEDMKGTARPSYSITSANSGADVAAASAAALAATSVALQSANYAQASEALAAAEDLYAFAKTVIPALSTPGCTASQTESSPFSKSSSQKDCAAQLLCSASLTATASAAFVLSAVPCKVPHQAMTSQPLPQTIHRVQLCITHSVALAQPCTASGSS